MPSSTTVQIAGRELSFTCHSGLLAGAGLANSLASVEECLRAGAFRIEIDVHSLAGGDYLVSHANRLEEVSDARGAIGALSRAAALELRDNRDPALRLPLLSDVVELCKPYNSELQLDLKDWRPLTPERAQTLAKLTEPLGERALVTAGRDWNLRTIARLAPKLRLGFDPGHYIGPGESDAPLPARLGAYGYRDDHPLAIGRTQTVAEYLRDRFDILIAQCPFAREMFIDYRLLLQAEAEGVLVPQLLHDRGVLVTAWTLDYDGDASMAKLQRLVAAGVDRVTTNTAQQFVRELVERGMVGATGFEPATS